MSSSSIIQWAFKREREEKEEKRERREKRYIFAKHNLLNFILWELLWENCCFIIIIFERGFLLEESILTKVFYWVSSRLCTCLSFCTNQEVFSTLLDPIWIKICVVFIVILWKYWTIVLVWAIGVSLVFLLKLTESCREQLINLAGFLISTGSRNWLINCMWTINWVSGTFFSSGVEKTGHSPWGRVNQYKIDCVSSS